MALYIFPSHLGCRQRWTRDGGRKRFERDGACLLSGVGWWGMVFGGGTYSWRYGACPGLLQCC